MLQELIIQNFAIIEKVDIHFDQGLSALTGETGAGKSIIIDALGLLIGNRGLTDYVRSDSAKAVVQGLFVIDQRNQELIQQFCQQAGIDFAEQTLIVKRELHKNGRNVCRVNDQLVPVTTLKSLGQFLVDISGQNQSQQLLDATTHVHLLDRFGSDQITSYLKAYQTTYREYQGARRQYLNLQQHHQQRAQQIDMLQFQINEIETAQLKDGEEEELLAQEQRLANFEKINQTLTGARSVLDDAPENILDQLTQVMKDFQQIQDLSPEFTEITQELESAYYELQDSQERISNQLDQQDYDPRRLSEIQERLLLIRNLQQKYGNSVAEIIQFGQQARQQLDDLLPAIQDPGILKEQLESLQQQLTQQASALNEQRQQVAQVLTEKISQQLKSMYMENTVFHIQFQTGDFTESGNQQIEFYLQTNPGEKFKPLVKIASGGELSRIMLALKTVFAQYQHVETLVFDEIDTGVSGRVAQAIGDQLQQISHDTQVLCITHLPQVAADSNQQYLVKKQVQHQHTTTLIESLNEEQRVAVIAQMLEGKKVTAITRQHAQELIRLARQSMNVPD
ncbi:DNA repair protein RecN [Bombilactobacillus folatiphilus]|uniref:DNA repair protein RecN n=1 Tax=Bombilactobacillus folatiphilus TaxID=2923362 RepID=A0ABY4P7N3_9LACO|nr:DNA repair protein RecN [Bombilactobacillus folatiphilus]UQS81622.1 DNA repair protein RecN [Bombilactobacillus folatiphilus]